MSASAWIDLLDVRNAGDEVHVGYRPGGAMRRVAAKHAVLACFHMVIPHIMPELPAPQREALAKNVKTPIVYTNVMVRNWRAFVTSRSTRSPRRCRSTIRCRSIFRSAWAATATAAIRTSRSACISSMCRARPTRGSMRAPSSASARASFYAMTFADFEARIRDDLDRMLGPGGFVQRARYRGDHRQPLAARLQLRRRTRFRPGGLRRRRCSSWRGAGRPCRDRQHRCGRRRLGALRHRSGGAGGGGVAVVRPVSRPSAMAEQRTARNSVDSDDHEIEQRSHARTLRRSGMHQQVHARQRFRAPDRTRGPNRPPCRRSARAAVQCRRPDFTVSSMPMTWLQRAVDRGVRRTPMRSHFESLNICQLAVEDDHGMAVEIVRRLLPGRAARRRSGWRRAPRACRRACGR